MGSGKPDHSNVQKLGDAVIISQGIFETSTTKKHRLGTRIQVGNRIFHYGKASGAVVTGKLNVIAVDSDAEDTITVAHALGIREVSITAASAIVAGQYDDGYLIVDEGTGAGDMYQVKSTPVIANAAVGKIALWDGLLTAWSTSDTDIELLTSPFIMKESVADQIDTPGGVPAVDIAADSFGWFQTWGPCAVLQDEANGAAAAERLLAIGSSTVGAVEDQDAAGEAFVGHRYRDANDEDAKYQLIMLQITP